MCSAGLEPTEIHLLTLRVLDESDIDTSALTTEGLDTYMARVSVQYAIVVCERTQAQCPRLYPFARETLFWPFEDPAAFQGASEAQLQKFRDVRDRIEARLLGWISVISVAH